MDNLVVAIIQMTADSEIHRLGPDLIKRQI
jgi:hypothetical protein